MFLTKKPNNVVDNKAINKFFIIFQSRLTIIFSQSLQKKIIAAKAVPKWRIKFIKTKFSLIAKNFSSKIKCPELDTGKNSVKPWTAPKIRDENVFSMVNIYFFIV